VGVTSGAANYFDKWDRKCKGKIERLPDDGWKEALELYTAQKEDLFQRRTPRLKRGSSGGSVC